MFRAPLMHSDRSLAYFMWSFTSLADGELYLTLAPRFAGSLDHIGGWCYIRIKGHPFVEVIEIWTLGTRSL
jgi:hypothetical protein